MDAVEIARQRAAELHSQAVLAGEDPWRPYLFAVAEAKRRGFDVEAAGPAMLDGSQAKINFQEELILHEQGGTDFEKAFLVAHEIGHLELGDGFDPINGAQSPTSSEPWDPARSAEPSPTGFDLVVDYGQRQRREVQMDLFARELLLPRHVVRALHLEDGLTASEIAGKLGAPFAVVAQQLLDALLLPAVVTAAAEGKPDKKLNALQREAADHRGCAYLLEAGPGTGKTQTLVARVEGLLDEGADPRRILVLTFSNKAAAEMADRIADKRKADAAAMWIGTFHAFGLDVIRRFHAELGLPKDPKMMDRTEAVELIENEFPRLGLLHYRNIFDPTQVIANMLSAISRAKDEVIDQAEYAELAAKMEGEAGVRAVEVGRVYAVYERLKRARDRIDFGDLISLPVRLLETNPPIREHFQSQYDHVLVDEYQDVNRSSIRLLTALKPSGINFWAVGDAKQSIYRFRGASSFNMSRFGKEDFAGGKCGRLKRNYRSTDNIVQAFSAFAVEMTTGDAEAGLEADRPAGEPVELRKMLSAEQQSAAVAEAIEQMRATGWTYRDQAVVCTGNEKLARLGSDLERLGIPVLFLGSLFERPEVKDLLSLLSILVDRRAMGIYRIGCWPDFRMALADVAALTDHLRGAEGQPASWMGAADRIPGLSADGQTSIRALATALNGFTESADPWTMLAVLLLDRTRIAARVSASADPIDRTRGIAVWQFLNFVRAQPAGKGLPITRLLDRVRRLLRLGDDRDLRQLPAAAQGLDAVRLMTIHGSKGLEFPVVHVPGINADTIPRRVPDPPCPAPDGMIAGVAGTFTDAFHRGQADEQECLFFVALSRARDRLFFYAPTQKSNGHARQLSPFLSRLGNGLISKEVAPVLPIPPAEGAESLTIRFETSLRFSASQIALYERCPRRFLYTHILQVGGRRTMTAYMQLHEAVRSVVQSLAAAAEPLPSNEMATMIEAAITMHDLHEHGYRDDFMQLAETLVGYFAASRSGLEPEPATPICVQVVGGEVFALPDDVLVGPDGQRIVRSIRTGHRRSKAGKDVGSAAFLLAARSAFPGAQVHLVHLADGSAEPVPLTDKEVANRKTKLEGFLEHVRQGRFPMERSEFTCPNCPAFFICGPVPDGEMTKKFA
ncbi:ATP-dependent helicase [Aquidulcibacter paucihalophilus]|jgi:superfamily I DNA/RNA helicase|nr:ATP-dependent helicase [Aquidulcibacter paucihalophilus]